MTEPNPDTVQPPIVVSSSAVSAQAGSGMRDVLLIVATLPALVAVLGTRDVNQIVQWLAGQQGVAFIGVVGVVGTALWRQWLARRQHAEKVVLADSSALGEVKR